MTVQQSQSVRESESGQGIVEYGLVLAMIALILISVLSTAVNNGLAAVAADVQAALGG
jgi:Flp pilus assembly pilin Flp